MLSTGPGGPFGREKSPRLEPWLLARCQHCSLPWLDQAKSGLVSLLPVGVANGVGGRRQRSQAQLLARDAAHAYPPVDQLEVARAGLEQLTAQGKHFFSNRACRKPDGVARGHQRPARVRARAPVEAAA